MLNPANNDFVALLAEINVIEDPDAPSAYGLAKRMQLWRPRPCPAGLCSA